MSSSSDTSVSPPRCWADVAYRTLGYFGLVSVLGAQLYGFRYNSAAPVGNFGYDLLLYGLFLVPHLVMTRSWYKRACWGQPQGSARERRVYIIVSVVTWLAVWFVQRPLPGPALTLPFQPVIAYFGILGFLLSVILFFQGITFETIDGMLGVAGSQGSYSHGAETPLFTSGAYGSVRHPMYRASLLASLSALIVHPNAAQLFWAILIPATFLAYIPIEEAQLLAARGEEYRQYQERTPYRIFRGIW